MDPLLKKLQHRPGDPVVVLGAPAALAPVLERWGSDVVVKRRLSKGSPFVLAFCRTRAEVADRGPKAARALADDGVLWMAYPKKSSPRYRSDLTRDGGWEPLGELGFEGVRQVAIDDDWSALRFRRTEQISRMERHPARAISTSGRARAGRARLAVVATVDPDVERYLAELPDDRREIVQPVHEVIRSAVPELAVAMWRDTIGYGSYHYRYATGREGDWYVIGLANQARYVSLYLCASEHGQYVAEANADRLGSVSVGRSCVRFRSVEDLDLDTVAELARRTADLVEAGAFEL